MLFGTNHKTKEIGHNFKLSLDNSEIINVKLFRFLGVTIDQNLSWKNHINELSKKCSSTIGILYKLNNFLRESALLSLYFTI